MIQFLARLSVGRPVTVAMTFLALLLMGAIAWVEIPVEMMPGRFTLNRMWVWVPYKDSSPRETERQIVRPMEDQLATAPGLKEMDTRASRGSARASLSFHRSISMDAAYNAVVDRMERAMSDFPDDVEQYWIYRWNPGDEPILWGGMSFPTEVEDLHHLVTEVIQKRIERIPGVGKVDIWGVNPKAVFIDIDRNALIAHNINLMEVMGALGSDNFQMATGRVVDAGKVRYIRSLARYEDLDVLREYPIGNGLVLSDIAKIVHRPNLSAAISRIEGRDGVAFGIYKESDANTAEVSEAIAETFESLQADSASKGVEFVTFFDQGEMIQNSIDNVLNTAMWGGLFAVIVLFAFLRQWRMTLLIAACIPFTLLVTVSITFFAGRSLNLLSLMGLMLAVGMVVDNAIVVVESISVRRQRGEDVAHSAVNGTIDIGLAISLSTLTTVVVFLPIILMSGDADFSFFMSELGMPVVWALGASLLVALFFTPLTTTLFKTATTIADPAWVTHLKGRYRQALAWMLGHRTDTLVSVLGMLFITIVVPVEAVGCNESEDNNFNEFSIRYQVGVDANYYDRRDLIESVDAYVEENKIRWGVRTWRARMRDNSQWGTTSVYLESKRTDEMMSRKDVLEDAKTGLPEVPGASLRIGRGGSDGPPRNQLNVYLHGEDTPTLERLGDAVQRVIEGIDGVVSAVPELEEEGGQEIRLNVNRSAANRHGVSPERISRTVSFALRASPLPPFHDGNTEVDVVSRFRLEDRADLQRLLDFPMWSQATENVVPLRALTDTRFAQGLGAIHRENRITSYPMQVDLDEGVSQEAAWARIEGALKAMQFPDSYTWSRSWSTEVDEDEESARLMALVLSITFVFLIMGVLFESFLLPLSIITTIPMAFLGAYWTLYITGTGLDMMGAVGLVILVGVVVNNGIVYIDLVTRLREEGMARNQALIDAGTRRLRPILMTALTTIFGLLPMAIGDASFVGMPYSPLGRVVAGGLATGTLLTLFLLPFLYTVLDDMRDTARNFAAHIMGKRKDATP
jgi:hydrophobic/amphiphilic exporter-1 (mainly G- bacteria), HAE1 family